MVLAGGNGLVSEACCGEREACTLACPAAERGAAAAEPRPLTPATPTPHGQRHTRNA